MDKEFIISYLQKRNYWWQTKSVEPVDKGNTRQEYLDKIIALSELERIICLSGIRRSGKTTILYQYIDYLLETSGVESGKIVYAKIDDLVGKIDSVHDILNTYHELTGLDPSKEAVYFLLDEIHVQKGWQLQLKYYLDAHAKCRFIISGSSTTLLYLDASESLAGRISFIDVFPLTFREFLEFNDDEIKIPQKPAIDSFSDIEKAYHSIIAHKQAIMHFLRLYFDTGGYPEWFKIRNIEKWQKTIVEDYFGLILFKDIVSVFKVKDPILLDRLVRDIAVFSTNRFTYSGLSERLGIDRETLKLYLYYLLSSSMIFVADVYTSSKKGVEKRPKKLYFWEEGLRRAVTLDRDDGKAAENVVAWHLIKRGHESKPSFEPYYWKNKYEVDFVYDDSRMMIPVEVKYKDNPSISELKGLFEFMDLSRVSFGIVVTKEMFKKETTGGHTIFYIPIWFFLMMI